MSAPGLDLPSQTRGSWGHQDPQAAPRTPRGCCSEHLHTYVPSVWTYWEVERLGRHLLGWGANTQLGSFLCSRNCGCRSKSTDISHLQAARPPGWILHLSVSSQQCRFKTRDLICGQNLVSSWLVTGPSIQGAGITRHQQCCAGREGPWRPLYLGTRHTCDTWPLAPTLC